MLRYIQFFCVFLCLSITQVYSKDLLNLATTQKLADIPRDTPIKVYTSIDTFCYVPSIAESGKIYLSIGLCGDKGAIPARYDVFGRIAYKINETWFCLTTPNSLATQTKDYALLTPCTLNNKAQQWKIVDSMIYNVQETYSLKDDGTYSYVARLSDRTLQAHTLHKDMQVWQDTIAQPGNLSIEMFIAWDLNTKDGNTRYFLNHKGSDRNTTSLYYNLENGHIAFYDPSRAGLLCLYGDNEGSEWNWIWWSSCTDGVPPALNRAYWKILPTKEREVAFLNFENNALRLTRYGANWGFPYTATPQFIQKDIDKSPISSFAVNDDMYDWLRFIAADAGGNLPYCPAPNTQIKEKRSPPTPLPSSFSFSDAWLNRLYAITQTTNASTSGVGICGICLLQSFQILAEILENPQIPRTSGGYFFDTRYGTDPFISFGLRNSILYDTLNDILGWFRLYMPAGTPVTPDIISLSGNNIALASAISLLPQYDWNIPVLGFNQPQINRVVDYVLNSPRGSVFILLMDLTLPSGGSGSHALVTIHANDGVRIIPTNVHLSTQEFRNYVAPVRTRAEFLARLTEGGYSLVRLSAMQANAFNRLPFAKNVSFNDCSGFGDHRRGSRKRPRSALVNQCVSGRCL